MQRFTHCKRLTISLQGTSSLITARSRALFYYLVKDNSQIQIKGLSEVDVFSEFCKVRLSFFSVSVVVEAAAGAVGRGTVLLRVTVVSCVRSRQQTHWLY